MPPRPSGATMRKRLAKTVPGAKRPQSVPDPGATVAARSAGRRVTSSIGLALVRLTVVESELLQRGVREAERRRFGRRLVGVPVIDDHPLDHPHRGCAITGRAMDEGRLIARR